MMRFCSGCGAERAGNAAFCARCGQQFPGEAPAIGAGAAAAAPPPQPAPAHAAVPPPQPAGYAPPPVGYPQPQAAKGSGVKRWVFIIVGIVLIGAGLLRVIDGMNGRGGRRSTSTSTASSTRLTYEWLVGTWSPGSGASACTTWIRFNDGGRLIDNVGTSGTWELVVYGTPNGDLTMSAGATQSRGRVTRIGPDRLRFGAQEWNRVTC